MSNDKNNEFAGEMLTPEVLRKQIIEIGKVNRVPPEVGIFDEPTRCFKVNLEWWQHIAGMVHWLADVTAWKEAENEEYFAIREILKFMQGIDCMNCEDVADCVESELATNEDFQDTIYNYINNSGFGNPNHVDADKTTVYDRNPQGALSEEIKELEGCNLDKLWGGIRNGIVNYLDDNAKTILEELALVSDTAERLSIFIDIIPVIGDLAEALAFQITEIVPDLLSLFNAYSSETHKNEIACAIFELVCSECRYPTFEEIFNYYKSNAVPDVPDLSIATLESVSEFLLELITHPSSIAYHTIVLWELFILNLNAAFNGNNGTKAIVEFAELGEDSSSNNWHSLCDGCHEEYAYVEYDYKTSDNNSYFVPGFFGTNQYTRIGGRGVIVQEGQNAASIGLPLDPSWKIRTINVKMSKSVSANYSSRELHLRPTPRTSTGQTTLSSVNCTDGLSFGRDGLLDISGFSEFALRVAPATGSGVGYVEKITIYYKMPFAPTGAIPTTDAEPCT